MKLDLELEAQEPGWSRAISCIPAGTDISAQRFFTILGAVDEGEALEAAMALEDRGIGLDVSQLTPTAQGHAAQRLELEAELARAGRLPGGLAPGDPLRQYWSELQNMKPLDEAGAKALLSSQGSSNRLTEGLLWLVTEEAPGFTGQGVLLQDLMQEGALGLMQAMEQPKADILDDARWHIRQAMARTVALQYLVSGEADRLLAAMRAYQQADRRLLNRLGRNPVPEELAQELGKTLTETVALGKMVQGAAQSPVPQPQEQKEEEPEKVEDSAYFQLRSRVEELLSLLDDTDRELLTLRFGLSGKAPQSTEEAARTLGISPEEASEREMAAILRLRQE